MLAACISFLSASSDSFNLHSISASFNRKENDQPLSVIAGDYNERCILCNHAGCFESDSIERSASYQNWEHMRTSFICDGNYNDLPFLPWISPAKVVATSSAVVEAEKYGKVVIWAE